MTLQHKQQRWLAIAYCITEGEPLNSNELKDKKCPNCATQNLIFSFTKKRGSRIGLFIVCQSCKAQSHFNLGLKPSGFREELILKEFQQIEDKVTELAYPKRKQLSKTV